MTLIQGHQLGHRHHHPDLVYTPGGVLGLKTDGGVPLAAENWTQKDREKN